MVSETSRPKPSRDEDELNFDSGSESEEEGERLFQRDMGLVCRRIKIPRTWNDELESQAYFSLRSDKDLAPSPKGAKKISIVDPRDSQALIEMRLENDGKFEKIGTIVGLLRGFSDVSTDDPTILGLMDENKYLKELLEEYALLAADANKNPGDEEHNTNSTPVNSPNALGFFNNLSFSQR